jgi:hypothetical protein
MRHQQGAANTGLQVFLGRVFGAAGKSACQRRLEGLELRRDIDLFVLHAHALGHVARIKPADIGRIGRRHHHRAHLVRAQRVHGNGQHQGRVHAARQADERARETVLAHIVAHGQHQRRPQRMMVAQLRLDLPHQRHAAIHQMRGHHGQLFLESRRARRHLTAGVHRKRAAVEHDFVLAAHQMGIDQGNRIFHGALRNHRLALGGFAAMERRGIDDGQQLGACGHGGPRRAGMPGVFANQQTDLDAVQLEDTACSPAAK